ncbi:MAG TPA: hypothetical protein VFN82_06000 [Solirubrobacterales bacterium]|nr:hypothetical protein [Solirubrobacterales bacterium]
MSELRKAPHPTTGSLLPRLLVALALALLALAQSALAAAPRDPISSGTTDLHMKKGFLRKLANNGIGVQGLGAGTVSGAKISLAVRNGKLDPNGAQGFLETRGGFKLTLGDRGVPVTRLTLNTVKSAVYATVAKARMQIGTISPPSTAREGFGANLKATQMALTEKAVRRISNRLGLRRSHRLNPGRVMSNAYSTARPELVRVLPEGEATFAVSSAALAKLSAKGVKPGGITALAPAKARTATSFALPFSGGTIAPDAGAGVVETAGGVQILKQAEPYSPTMRITNVWLDLKQRTATVELEILPTPPFPGATGRTALAELSIEPDQIFTSAANRTVTIRADARLQASAASTFNDVFNQPAPQPPPASNFVVGDPLGRFSMTIHAR